MKALVVGGAGYVGSVLVEELLERGYAVKVFDRLYYGDGGLDKVRERVELVVGDMRNMDSSVLDEVDAVINLGGLSNDPTAEYNPKANYEMNTVATESLAKFCKEVGVKRYIFASSCSIYDVGVEAYEKDVILDETSEVAPKAAYSSSKYEAERRLLSMMDENFCPVILRYGTIYGFSPRMRYDLVVNTFLKDVLSKGYMEIYYGGEMWRPLVDVQDAARAYIACLEADEEKVKGEVFNVVYANFRISELALRVREALREIGIEAEIKVDYGYKGVRSYRVSGKKIERILGYRPIVSVEESVKNMVNKIKEYEYTDFDNPKYYNIKWMKLLEEADEIIKITNTVFEAPVEGYHRTLKTIKR
ncbi:MAG: SDR family oxidoreductase [bacterium]|nr:SDR family oxidoreductase [bacterium]